MIHCFGDSWTAEYSELEMIYDENKWNKDHLRCWPSMLGDLLDCETSNRGQNGYSQGDMLYELSKTNLQKGDIVIFALTAPSRRFYLDHDGNNNRVIYDTNKDGLNDHNDSWISAQTILTAEFICDKQNAGVYFFNMFDSSFLTNAKETTGSLWQLVDKTKWLVPPDTTLVAQIFDKQWFGRYKEYHNSDFLDWINTGNSQVKKLIHPCKDHPNQKGKKLIAEFVAEKIKQKEIA